MTSPGVARPRAPCLALDIGATKVEAAIVHVDGVRRARRERLDVDGRTDDLFDAIVELLAQRPRRRATSTSSGLAARVR